MIQGEASVLAEVPRFVLRHPDDPTVHTRYGYDEKRGGPWCEIPYSGTMVVHDASVEDYDHDRPMFSVLLAPGEYGFVAPADVIDALWCLDGRTSRDENLPVRHPPGWLRRGRPRRGVRRVLRVIANLEASG